MTKRKVSSLNELRLKKMVKHLFKLEHMLGEVSDEFDADKFIPLSVGDARRYSEAHSSLMRAFTNISELTDSLRIGEVKHEQVTRY